MTPRYGSPPDPDRRYTLRPGAYAILPLDGRVLVTVEAGTTREVQLPGGGIDPGEQPLAALYREVMEETGWRIATPRLLARYRRFVFMPDYGIHAEKVCSIYIARPVRRMSDPTEPHHRAVWMTPRQTLATLASTGDAAVLADHLVSSIGTRSMRMADTSSSRSWPAVRA